MSGGELPGKALGLLRVGSFVEMSCGYPPKFPLNSQAPARFKDHGIPRYPHPNNNNKILIKGGSF